jgi:hypothetical protein
VIVSSSLTLLFIVLSIWGFSIYRNHESRVEAFIASPSDDPIKASNLALVGDSYGSVNSLLSLLTVVGLAIGFLIQTIFAHNQDRANQSNDKKNTLETFENSFHTLLNLFIATREVLESQKKDSSKRDYDPIAGRMAIVAAMGNIAEELNLAIIGKQPEQINLQKILTDWKSIGKTKNHFSFRQAFLLVKSILSSIDDLRKQYPDSYQRYVDICRAILSPKELYFLCFYVLGTADEEYRSLMLSLSILPDFNERDLDLDDKVQTLLAAKFTTEKA